MQPQLDKQATTSGAANYAFDYAGECAQGRYRELSALYDAQTIRHLERTGIESGWSCLEVGGGRRFHRILALPASRKPRTRTRNRH